MVVVVATLVGVVGTVVVVWPGTDDVVVVVVEVVDGTVTVTAGLAVLAA